MGAGMSQADSIRGWNADLDDPASKHRRSPLQRLRGCRRRRARTRVRLFYSVDAQSDGAH